jgi:hypothetical protein
MKALTLTAVMATIVALPILFGKRRAKVQEERVGPGVHPYEDPRRYDLFDFVGS